ncbi:protein-disulfide reductase DsbD domain-containing protein [Pseudidiomarina mangrovi]|uniref:protein-disulfide reductase DsbD domain-containing protein n=1 Tax=Pseudidiomarina mangrovi TaxID=2487133 RepID=UPI000FCA48EB|nr:protein-disulfide reductase DsbD domain-containing protein [Pseudidiomarina mangrovi]
MTLQSFPSGDALLQPQFLPVDQAYQFDFQQRGNQLTLSWDIADGYYLYQHRFVADPTVALLSEPTLPEGTNYHDEFFGDVVIYRDQVSITYELAAASADQPFVISYQGCADAGLCYPPTEKVVYLQALQDTGAVIMQPSPTTPPSGSELALPWWSIALLPLLLVPIVIIRGKRAQQQK